MIWLNNAVTFEGKKYCMAQKKNLPSVDLPLWLSKAPMFKYQAVKTLFSHASIFI